MNLVFGKYVEKKTQNRQNAKKNNTKTKNESTQNIFDVFLDGPITTNYSDQ